MSIIHWKVYLNWPRLEGHVNKILHIYMCGTYTCVVSCTSKAMCGGLSKFFIIHLFSTPLITLFLVSPVQLIYSTFDVLFSIHIVTFSFSCSYYLINTPTHCQNHSVYNSLQVFLLFVYATRNTGEVTTLYINALMASFSKLCSKLLFVIT